MRTHVRENNIRYENLDFINNCKNIHDLKHYINYINNDLAAIGAPIISEVPEIKIEDTEETKTFRKGIVTQCFTILVELHHIGIAHNDAHLNNFMCDKDYNFYLIDFGYAKPISLSYPEKDFETLKDNLTWFPDNDFPNLKYLVDHYQSLLDKNGIKL